MQVNAEGILQTRRFPVLALAAGWGTAFLATMFCIGHYDFDVQFGRAFIPWVGVLGVFPPLILVARDVLAVEDGSRPLADVFFYFILSLLGFGLAYFALSIGELQLDGVASPWNGPGDQFHNSPKLDFGRTCVAVVDSLFISCRGLGFQGLTAASMSSIQKLLAVAQATTSFGIILLAIKSLGRRRAG